MTERRFTCLPSLCRAPRPSHACSLCARGRPRSRAALSESYYLPAPRPIRVMLPIGSSPCPSTHTHPHTLFARAAFRASVRVKPLTGSAPFGGAAGGRGVLRVVSSLSESRISPLSPSRRSRRPDVRRPRPPSESHRSSSAARRLTRTERVPRPGRLPRGGLRGPVWPGDCSEAAGRARFVERRETVSWAGNCLWGIGLVILSGL